MGWLRNFEEISITRCRLKEQKANVEVAIKEITPHSSTPNPYPSNLLQTSLHHRCIHHAGILPSLLKSFNFNWSRNNRRENYVLFTAFYSMNQDQSG